MHRAVYLTEKGSDLSHEYSLSLLDWVNAANRAVAWTCYWHGDVRANPLQNHHEFVLQVGKSHSWPIVLEYNVQQRKIAETDIYHNLSTPNMKMLLLIASKPTHMRQVHQPFAVQSPSKRKYMETHNQFEWSPKRVKSDRFRCFQCGKPGHFPAVSSRQDDRRKEPISSLTNCQKRKCYLSSWQKTTMHQVGQIIQLPIWNVLYRSPHMQSVQRHQSRQHAMSIHLILDR